MHSKYFLGAASAALLTAGLAIPASAAIITIDLTGASAMQSSFNIDLGAANYPLLEALGFTPAGGPFFLNVAPTAPAGHSAGLAAVRSSEGMGVCSRINSSSGACSETANGGDAVDGHGGVGSNQGADWEGLTFSLTGEPANFQFILVSATFMRVSHEAGHDSAFFLYSGNSPIGESLHIFDNGVCTGTGGGRTCTVAFNELGRDFEFRAFGQNDAWTISAIQWEITALQVPTPTPEPAVLGLLGLGLAGVSVLRRRQRRAN